MSNGGRHSKLKTIKNNSIMETKHKFSQPIANWKSKGVTLGIYETLEDFYILTIWEHTEKVQIYHYSTRAQAKAMFNKMICELLETL